MTATADTDTTTAWEFPWDRELARHRKRIEGNEEIVPPIVEAWHEGQDAPTWIVYIPHCPDGISQRDASLHAADIMAATASADYILLTIDTHMSSLPENPKTGKPWGPGEMQAMCDEEGFCETGLMRDNLLLALVRRTDQKIQMRSIPYHFHADHSVLFYEEVLPHDEWTSEDDEMRFTGIVPDALREAMARPSITDMVAAAGGYAALGFDPDLDAREIQLHQMLGGARVLMMAAASNGAPNMYLNVIPARGPEEMEIIRASAEHGNFEFVTHDEMAEMAKDDEDGDEDGA